MKYRIVELEYGNGAKYYFVEHKIFLFWKQEKMGDGSKIFYDDFERAKGYIDRMKERERCDKVVSRVIHRI